MYINVFKRVFDLILACSLLLILIPLLIFIAVLVWLKLGRPILFCQLRPGKNEKTFKIYKFRSMLDIKNVNHQLLADDLRLTKFGKFLRSTSIDELPEIFNIINGDMSFVGPRPQLIKDIHFMSEEQRTRHLVLPGLTGLAQINGRNSITWEKKLNYDLQYIKNVSFLNDFKILIKSILYVIRRRDITNINSETSEDLAEYLLNTGKISLEEYNSKLNIQ